jgi:iron complex transport system substrate-binding protein
MLKLQRYSWLFLLVVVAAGCGAVPNGSGQSESLVPAAASPGPSSSPEAAAAATSSAVQSPAAQASALASQASPAGACRTIKQNIANVSGETTICGHPQRIAVLGDYPLDLLVTLGMEPLAFGPTGRYTATDTLEPAKIRYLGQFLKTPQINLESRNEPNLERLVAMQPDLIVGELVNKDKLYSELAKIAPILLVDSFDWQGSLKSIGNALDHDAAAQTFLDSYRQREQATKAALASYRDAHPRMLVVAAAAEDLKDGVIVARSPDFLHQIFSNLGFEWLTATDPGLEWYGSQTTIPLDQMIAMDPDTVIVVVYGYEPMPSGETTFDVGKLKRAWEATPQLKSMRAMREGRVHFVDYGRWLNIHGPHGAEFVLSDLEKLLGQ